MTRRRPRDRSGRILRLALPAALAVLLLAPAAPPEAAVPRGPAFREAAFGASSLRLVSGVPILALEGTPAEMGRAQGTLLKEPIRFLKENYLATWLKRFGAYGTFLQGARAYEPRLEPAEREEIRALSEAAGIPIDEGLLIHSFLDMTQPFLCSGVVVSAGKAGPGGAILARNLDFLSLGVAERYSLVCVRRPAKGKRTITVGWPGMTGTLTGLNEDGLALATLVAYGFRGEMAPGPPYMLTLKRVLDSCATVGEAKAALGKAARTTANSLLLLDAKGEAACVEYTPKAIESRGFEDGFLLATNDFVKLAPPGGFGKTDDRFDRLRAWRAGVGGPLQATDLCEPLRRAQMGSLTLQSIIVRPSDKRLWISIGRTRAAEGTFVELDGAALLKGQEPTGGKPAPSP